jgi:hypothetical protein
MCCSRLFAAPLRTFGLPPGRIVTRSSGPFIIVDVLGFLPDESTICTEDDKRGGKCE